MRHYRHHRHFPALRRGLARFLAVASLLAVAVLRPAAPLSAGWSLFADPVGDLRKALAVAVHEGEKHPAGLAVRKRSLSRCAAGLRNLKELREALLLREWRDVTHEVTVIDGGYEHQGKRYLSLSAVARAITGTQWSGPLFFGLRKTGSGA